MFREISVSGSCFDELNTELRFAVADARASGVDLLRIAQNCEHDDQRATNRLIKVLRAIMRSGGIQFYVFESDLNNGSTESEFLANKYEDVLRERDGDSNSVYVKL